MSKLKFLLCLGVLFSVALISSCSKDEKNNEKPGEIAGLGEYEGELQGEAFNLPAGIELNGAINGYRVCWYSMNTNSSITSAHLKKQAAVTEQSVRYTTNHSIALGSGKHAVVLIPLKNTTDTEINVIFPARLILKSKSPDYQNGVLLKKATITVPANSTYNVALQMYCGNLGRTPSDDSSIYEWGVISSSKLLKEMTDLIADKKINIEEFNGDYTDTYIDRERDIQLILWSITDSGIGMTKEDKSYLQALPKSSK